MSELVWTIRNLKWRSSSTSRTGIRPATVSTGGAATVSLTGKDGKALAALAVGKQESGLTYVRIPGQPALYTIESKTLGDLPTMPEELLL